MSKLSEALGLNVNEGESPFPWQEALLSHLQSGVEERLGLDIPTGLGKTSIMAAWLVARAQGAALPRRLVYVVDRRAVVDQATQEAERLREWLKEQPDVKQQLGLETEEQLLISTLRGQFADNRQWLSDPTSPAIVVGTVDMIGSRLLFQGYGVSRKMRPYHAGYLGADTLFVLDEAHLVPPFEALLQRIVTPATQLCGVQSAAEMVPRSILLSLSATGRDSAHETLQITDDDLNHEIAGKRLRAKKRIQLIEPDDESTSLIERLAQEAWSLSEEGTAAKRIIVFCNSRTVATKVNEAVTKRAKGDKKNDIPKREISQQLFVGARRVRERQQVATWLEENGFLAGSPKQVDQPAFVFATSAGEVGVDLDADHKVCDLVAFERMVQRLGRVNRRGEGDAEVRVLLERDKPTDKEKKDLKKALDKAERLRGAKEHELVNQFDKAPKYRAALEALPRLDNDSERDGSPEALRQLKLQSGDDENLDNILKAATTAAPLRPELTRPILDSWSMTSLEEHAARPKVAPWLRGWVDDDPQTTIVWRKHLPTESKQCTNKQIKDFFEAAPLHLTEKLETGSSDVFKWLLSRASRIAKLRDNPKKIDAAEIDRLPDDNDIVAIVVDHSFDIVRTISLYKLQFEGGKQVQNDKKQFARELERNTLIVDARLGGMNSQENSGLLDDKAPVTEPAEAADGMLPSQWMPVSEAQATEVAPIPPFKVIDLSAEDVQQEESSHDDPNWKTCYQLPIYRGEAEEPIRFFTVQKYRQTVTSEESRSTTGICSLEKHLSDIAAEANRLADRLELSPELRLALVIAARNHDHGKDCDRWQKAFSAPDDGRPYAKTPGPFRSGLLEGYRHEFASLPLVYDDPEFATLSEELQELTLHLVAAHHGFARPTIRTDGCNEAPSVLQDRARDVALRFAHLQQHWGPWGLAWLESILRAADQRASREVEEQAASNTKQDTLKEVAHG